MTAAAVKAALKGQADPEKAAYYPRFFKTGPGEYGEGDKFVGVTVPKQRKIARAHRELPEPELLKLLESPYHEHRHTALLIASLQYPRHDDEGKAALYRFLLKHKVHINNWDMVDLIAPKVIGVHILAVPSEEKRFETWAKSKRMWDRRIAVMSTFPRIRGGDFAMTLSLAERLLDDPHDLMHKAVGWMLREVGNRDLAVECAFLDAHVKQMPRTMLRYAIEKFPDKTRKAYLAA